MVDPQGVLAHRPARQLQSARLPPLVPFRSKRDDLMPAGDHIRAMRGANILVIRTEWKEFRTVDFAWLKRELNLPVVVNGRNLNEPKALQQAGLLYYGVGRGESN